MNIRLITAIITLGTAFVAHSAGYQLNEYSAVNMGRSFAGMGVAGDDFSATGYNPAGMVYNKRNGLQSGASLVRLHSTFKGWGNFDDRKQHGSGHTNPTRVMPNLFGQYKLSDDLTLGLGLYVPFGLATDYPNGWFGEDHAGLSQITVIDLGPSLSYKINDYLAIGGAVNLQHVRAHLTDNKSNLKGRDWNVGYLVGLTITPIDSLRIGLSYRSKVEHKLDGSVKSRQFHGLRGDVSAKIATPETSLLSIAWDVNEKWMLTGTARWTRWKRFNSLDVNIGENNFPLIQGTALIAPSIPSGTTISSTKELWRNTGFYALGADYKVNSDWTIRAGIGYDMTAIRSARYRTPRIPDGRRVWNSLGFSYAYNDMQVDVGYAHIFVFGGHARGTEDKLPKPNIKYSSNGDMFSLGFQYKF